MKSRSIFLASLAVLAVLVVFSVLLATRDPAPGATDVRSPLIGHPAPPVSGVTLSGAHLSLAQDHGHIVVLTFWASWCPPCQQEAPELSTFAWQQRPAGVDVIGVVWEDTVASARAFQTDYGSLYPSIVDPNGAIANSYGVTGPPTTFVISPTGTVVASLLGATTTAQLDRLVAEARA